MQENRLEVLAEVLYISTNPTSPSYLFLLCSDNNLYFVRSHYKAWIAPFEASSIGSKCDYLTYEKVKDFSIIEWKDGRIIYGKNVKRQENDIGRETYSKD